jgi:hypothetical protein
VGTGRAGAGRAAVGVSLTVSSLERLEPLARDFYGRLVTILRRNEQLGERQHEPCDEVPDAVAYDGEWIAARFGDAVVYSLRAVRPFLALEQRRGCTTVYDESGAVSSCVLGNSIAPFRALYGREIVGPPARPERN